MLWLLGLLPLMAGTTLYVTGEGRRRRLAVVAGAALALTLLFTLMAAGFGWHASLAWSDTLHLSAGLTPLSAVMAVLVPAVALPIVIYATVHESTRALGRLIAILLVFVGAMEILVIAADLLTLLIGWELVGACSWALIGHHWRDAGNPRAGRFAFVVTRFGDLGLFIAAMAAFAATGSFAYADLGDVDGPLLHLLVAGVLVSAAAKSGQAPFAPWLFRAMAGPTSVSALLHAATMVAAGAYLLVRLHPTLAQVGWFTPAVLTVGLVTALGGGLVALLQSHAKKLLAASTSAHYGLMFAAVGAGFPGVAMLHLVAHALFKALLFLSVGVVGERAGTFDLTRMRFGDRLPGTAALAGVGALALAGVPPLGAAWTKEAVVTAAGHANALLAIGTAVAGGVSAAYAVRFQALAFGTAADGADVEPTPRCEWGAMLALAVLTVVLSVLWLPVVRDVVSIGLDTELPASTPWESVTSFIAVLAGLYAGWLTTRVTTVRTDERPISAALAEWLGLPALIDEAVVRPTAALARCTARADDGVVDALPRGVAALGQGTATVCGRFGEWLVDALPEGTAGLVDAGGGDTRRLQTGLSHHYYAIMALAALAIAGILMIWS